MTEPDLNPKITFTFLSQPGLTQWILTGPAALMLGIQTVTPKLTEAFMEHCAATCLQVSCQMSNPVPIHTHTARLICILIRVNCRYVMQVGLYATSCQSYWESY